MNLTWFWKIKKRGRISLEMLRRWGGEPNNRGGCIISPSPKRFSPAFLLSTSPATPPSPLHLSPVPFFLLLSHAGNQRRLTPTPHHRSRWHTTTLLSSLPSEARTGSHGVGFPSPASGPSLSDASARRQPPSQPRPTILLLAPTSTGGHTTQPPPPLLNLTD